MPTLSFGGFDWDKGNLEKCQKHGLSIETIESFLLSEGIYLTPDSKHSETEERVLTVGLAISGKPMIVIFTWRKRDEKIFIRPISARYMHEKEIKKYRKESSLF